MTTHELTRLDRRRATALRQVEQLLIDLAHRDSDGPLGRYELRDVRRALEMEAAASSRAGPPMIDAAWPRDTSVSPDSARELLQRAKHRLSPSMPPKPLKKLGHPRSRMLKEIPEHYGVRPTYPRAKRL
jgi:hypothetical protein